MTEALASASCSDLTLLDLPVEIHKLIVQCLRPSNGLLFVPSPLPDDRNTDLKGKAIEYYGKQTEDQLRCSEGLIAWSSTCLYFRDLIGPELFKTVILRSNAKSVQFTKALSQTRYWPSVERLIFGGPSEDIAEIEYQVQFSVSDIQEETRELAAILSNLPPNLTSLTLDFPTKFPMDWAWGVIWEPPDSIEDDENFADAEKSDTYRALLKTVFDAVSRNDFSMKKEFDFRVHNLPPLHCTTYQLPKFHHWLTQITSFNLSLADAHKTRTTMNATIAAERFAPRLSEYFFNHLHCVHTFQLHGDKAFNLGLTPAYPYLPLVLPSPSQSLAKVTHVSFKQIFICSELVEFLIARAKQLVSVELTDCHGGETYDNVMVKFTWAQLFNALADTGPDRLTAFDICTSSPNGVGDMYSPSGRDSAEADDLRLVDRVIARQREQEAQAYKDGASRADVKRRRRWIFPYGDLGEESGILMQDIDLNAACFLLGNDYDAYLRLIEIIEANMTRAGISYFPTSGTALPSKDLISERLITRSSSLED